ncbi:BTAD domain-containing putative transcriptional regulator [Nocardia sp. NPDC057353]|uniref:AfsR/SARP family transcriptional regulator n=1 Tax=Nocardia sp. NPDC057353 TaxID=3346104 RepID=UPI0036401FFF
MEMKILGPLELGIGGRNIAPTAPKSRKVLATLLAEGGRWVPFNALMRELWDDEPVASAATTLQTYILGLRRSIAAALQISPAEVANDILVTCPGGYMFRTEHGRLDAQLFRSLFTAGRRVWKEGDDVAAIQMLRGALGLWRGQALVDVGHGPILEARCHELAEARLYAAELLIECEIRLGMYREILPELAVLTAENPLHEGIHAQYMRALYLDGRRAQALGVFVRLRTRMVTELGLEPSAPIQQLRQAILRADDDDFASSLTAGDPSPS